METQIWSVTSKNYSAKLIKKLYLLVLIIISIITIFKKSFKTYDCAKPIKETNDNNVLVLDNLDIFTFERFIKYSIINISCHSGFIVQVRGANNGQVLDIINENDIKWYKCWVPSMIFHKIDLKSTIKNCLRNLELIFDDIIQTAKKL